MAKSGGTAVTVDLVTMYPNFNQAKLKERLKDALEEAWAWEEYQMHLRKEQDNEDKELRIKRDGWVELTKADLAKPTIGIWSKEEVLEMLLFVIDNGFVK